MNAEFPPDRPLDRLVDFYQKLTPEGVARFPEFYAGDAYFKDPFNEVRGVAAIQGIFHHMYRQISEPRFAVTERIEAANGVMLVWELYYRMRFTGSEMQVMRGVPHLRVDDLGYVTYHRDYWDAAEELYEKLPGIGAFMRFLKRRANS